MEERGILFGGPMVRVILENRKRMTRRLNGLDAVNQEPDAWVAVWCKGGNERLFRRVDSATFVTVRCPYGQPGDRLWVREEHYAYGRWVRDGFTKKGNPKWRFRRVEEMPIRFDAPVDGFKKSRDKSEPGKEQWYQRRARFMPKSAARIWLEITAVRVERLHDISEAFREAYGKPLLDDPCVYSWFVDLWSTINGRESWDANPWVWVIEFRRV